jgi:hypothetical protein
VTARLVGTLRCTFTPAGRRRRRRVYDLFQRDPELRLPAAAAMVGPHRIPAAAFDHEAVERLLAL